MMDMNAMNDFARKGEAAVVAEAKAAIKSVALSIYSDVTTAVLEAGDYGSPVASGRLVASTRLSINTIDSTYEPADPDYKYPAGAGPRPLPPRTIRNMAISRAAAQLNEFKLGDTIYITNSVPYIRRIEIAGYSWQAPGGVFGPTIRKALEQFKNFAGKITRV